MAANNSTTPWAAMLDALKDFTPDFMADGRQQPAMQVREEHAFAPQPEAGPQHIS